jgi:hypothetical protein
MMEQVGAIYQDDRDIYLGRENCHWWMRCSDLDKRKQEANPDPCEHWQRLGTTGQGSGWV